MISSTIAQGGGDDGEQWSAEGEAERRNAAELDTSRTTLIASTISQGGGDDGEQGGAGGEAERRNAAEPAPSWSTLRVSTTAQGSGKRDRGAIGEESNPGLRATGKTMRGGARRKIPKQRATPPSTYGLDNWIIRRGGVNTLGTEGILDGGEAVGSEESVRPRWSSGGGPSESVASPTM